MIAQAILINHAFGFAVFCYGFYITYIITCLNL
jgi:hypothetical protein